MYRETGYRPVVGPYHHQAVEVDAEGLRTYRVETALNVEQAGELARRTLGLDDGGKGKRSGTRRARPDQLRQPAAQ
ncbi:MAG: hypothetical protein OHK0015_28070 [Chloroflexi bacterium OHK40]